MSEIPSLVDQFPYLGLYLLLVLGGIGFPFPEDTTLILCGFLWAHEVVRPLPALVVVYSGMLSADYFLYFVGRKYGRAVVKHKRFQKFISPERVALLEEKFRKRGTLVILIGRHILGLRAQLFLVAGIMRMSRLKFLSTDGLSAVITLCIMVGTGYIGGYSLQKIEKDISRIGYLAMFLLIVSLAVYFFLRYLKMRRRTDTKS
jgi:membrane protein DedA with SNARE-associated domain